MPLSVKQGQLAFSKSRQLFGNSFSDLDFQLSEKSNRSTCLNLRKEQSEKAGNDICSIFVLCSLWVPMEYAVWRAKHCQLEFWRSRHWGLEISPAKIF